MILRFDSYCRLRCNGEVACWGFWSNAYYVFLPKDCNSLVGGRSQEPLATHVHLHNPTPTSIHLVRLLMAELWLYYIAIWFISWILYIYILRCIYIDVFATCFENIQNGFSQFSWTTRDVCTINSFRGKHRRTHRIHVWYSNLYLFSWFGHLMASVLRYY